MWWQANTCEFISLKKPAIQMPRKPNQMAHSKYIKAAGLLAGIFNFYFFYRYKQTGTQFLQTSGCSLEPNYHFSFSRSSSLLIQSKQKCLLKKWGFFSCCLPWHLKHHRQIMTSKKHGFDFAGLGFFGKFQQSNFWSAYCQNQKFCKFKVYSIQIF